MNPACLRWRRLTPAELARVYETEMCRDFPPSERKPLAMIQAGLKELNQGAPILDKGV